LYRKHNIGQENFIAPDEFIVAKSVFLGAGALGSTEILLRSQSKSNGNLKFSSKLGQRFSGNGDMLGFTYNGDTPMNSVGLGETPAPPQDMIDDKRWKGVGPCISGIVDARETKTLADQMIMEDGTPPGLLRPLYSMVLQTEHLRSGATSDGKFIDKIQELYRKLSGRAVDNTLAWLTMAHDDSNGKMVLDHDRLSIDWEGVGQQPIFQKIKKNLETAAGAHKATPLKNPVWDPMFNDRLVTVHPLGGCPMGDNVEKGAVDHRGRVFNADGTICEGLYVCDGAIVPRSLGVNPLLTIAALAERVMRLYIQEDLKHKKLEVYGFEKYKDVKIEDFPVPKPGIQFTERMAGKLVLGEFRDIPDFCALPDTGSPSLFVLVNDKLLIIHYHRF
jgi:cholesterol oxidase